MQDTAIELGIIGGSGLYRLTDLSNVREIESETPWGRPSDAIRVGEIGGQQVAFLARHGRDHSLTPTRVPYAANIYALKQLGVRRLVSISAVGSLREDIPPRSFLVPDDIIDRTVRPSRTFFDRDVVAHVSIAPPFCPTMARWVAEAAATTQLEVRAGGTYVAIEGPQFSTLAESHMHRSWGASVVGMTAMPEARFAREAQLCYACLALVTDYDVWHDDEGPVSVAGVIENLHAMIDGVQQIVHTLATSAAGECELGCSTALENAISTPLSAISAADRERYGLLMGELL